ncbi:hypothetical protein ABZ570_01410 [Micromonospora sp. NPDC007271]
MTERTSSVPIDVGRADVTNSRFAYAGTLAVRTGNVGDVNRC